MTPAEKNKSKKKMFIITGVLAIMVITLLVLVYIVRVPYLLR